LHGIHTEGIGIRTGSCDSLSGTRSSWHSRSELEIPSSLDEIILACLAKDPDDRPSSVTEVEGLLAATCLGRHWTVEQRGRWWESHRPRASPPNG
jgi:serine/threonine protein kinase